MKGSKTLHFLENPFPENQPNDCNGDPFCEQKNPAKPPSATSVPPKKPSKIKCSDLPGFECRKDAEVGKYFHVCNVLNGLLNIDCLTGMF